MPTVLYGHEAYAVNARLKKRADVLEIKFLEIFTSVR